MPIFGVKRGGGRFLLSPGSSIGIFERKMLKGLSPGLLRHCKILCRPCQYLRHRLISDSWLVTTNSQMCKLQTIVNISYVIVPTHIIAGEH